MTTQIEKIFSRIQEVQAEYSQMEEETGRDKQDMKQIIRYYHLEALIQEEVDISLSGR